MLSRTGSFATEIGSDSAEREARLYATLYADQDGWQQRWQIRDLMMACPLDLMLAFTNPPVFVSDADQDGEPEIWVGYRLACRGDVSPADLKLIGYEGAQKLAPRGSTRVRMGESVEGGDSKADAALSAQPKLLEHALALWE